MYSYVCLTNEKITYAINFYAKKSLSISFIFLTTETDLFLKLLRILQTGSSKL